MTTDADVKRVQGTTGITVAAHTLQVDAEKAKAQAESNHSHLSYHHAGRRFGAAAYEWAYAASRVRDERQEEFRLAAELCYREAATCFDRAADAVLHEAKAGARAEACDA